MRARDLVFLRKSDYKFQIPFRETIVQLSPIGSGLLP